MSLDYGASTSDRGIRQTHPVTDLADVVLPLIRTRSDLHRWSVANAHGARMNEAVAILERAAETDDPATVFGVTQKAIDSAVKVILRADDSSGIIGGAIHDLLTLHARVAERAKPPAAKLVAWLIKFLFDGNQDFFTIDPVAYATALGPRGIALYRKRLDDIAAQVGPPLTDDEEVAARRLLTTDPAAWRRQADKRHAHFMLEWNARRLAVLDRDVEAIIRTHARDRRVARWLHDTAEALAEIDEPDLAIEWASQAAHLDSGHQSANAADYWCRLLAEHRPDDLLAATMEVFRRWPTATHAGRLYEAAGDQWPAYRDEVMARLSSSPRDAVLFAMHSLGDLDLAWSLARELALSDSRLLADLAKEYEKVDPLAVIPILSALVLEELQVTDAMNYRYAARRLAKMRKLAAGSEMAANVDDFIAHLRATHHRRPRLQLEFDRAGLP
jgi:hypothetical protein